MYNTEKDWIQALELSQKAIDANPTDLHAYLSINYLLMNLLVEEDYEDHLQVFYAGLLRKYFLESYSKFSSNKEYLFFTGITAHMSEWYFDIDIAEAKEMIKQAFQCEPNNKIYQWGYYTYTNVEDEMSKQNSFTLSNEIIKDTITAKKLINLGIFGEYILGIMEHISKA